MILCKEWKLEDCFELPTKREERVRTAEKEKEMEKPKQATAWWWWWWWWLKSCNAAWTRILIASSEIFLPTWSAASYKSHTCEQTYIRIGLIRVELEWMILQFLRWYLRRNSCFRYTVMITALKWVHGKLVSRPELNNFISPHRWRE
jgi:hypothetical protein